MPDESAILLVEDDQNDILFMRQAFKKAGIVRPLRLATDGQMAIDYLEGRAQFCNREEFPFPSIVLLDLKLPRVMGLEVLKWIRQKFGFKIVVLILSASKNDADVEEAYRLGANAYLVKPSDVGHLCELVAAIQDFWLRQNIAPSQPLFTPRTAG